MAERMVLTVITLPRMPVRGTSWRCSGIPDYAPVTVVEKIAYFVRTGFT